jgi:hypothetical protein
VEVARLPLRQLLVPELLDLSEQFAGLTNVGFDRFRLGRKRVGLALAKQIDPVYELVWAAVDCYGANPGRLLPSA